MSKLRQRGERSRRTARLAYFASALGFVIVLVAAVSFRGMAGTMSAAIGSSMLVGLIVATMSRGSAVRRQIHFEEQQVVTVVNQLREVVPFVAAHEEWTEDHYESIRRRISYFPIAAR